MRSWVPRSLRARLLLVVVAAQVLALSLIGLLTFAVLDRSLDREATQLAEQRAQSELSYVTIGPDGVVVRPRTPRSETVATWVFQGSVAVRLPDVTRPQFHVDAQRLATSGDEVLDVDDPPVRFVALPIVEDGDRIGTVVAAVSLIPYNESRRIALVALTLGAVVILLGVTALTWWSLRRAIAPVDRLTADAALWSETSPERRFAMGPPHDEITRLARTLDDLLDRIDASLRRERRLTAEISHELRTPVAGITAEAELALRKERSGPEYREALERTADQARRMEATIETLLASARASSPTRATSRVGEAIDEVVEETAPLASASEVEITRGGAELLRIGVERNIAARVLGPIVDNAIRYADHTVEIAASRVDGTVVVTVVDDGPGVAPEELEAIFEPAVRGTNAVDGGTGLGLPLARRLARTAGGDVVAAPGPGGRFEARFPTA